MREKEVRGNDEDSFRGIRLPESRGYVLASIFRPAFVRALLERRHIRIIQEMGLLPLAKAGATQAGLYECVYRYLHQKYRCEYIYKNEILQTLFLARHNPSRAAVTSEFFVGSNRLDLLVINGTTEAYEVKTGYDDLERLPVQTTAYLSVFDRVNVVCDPVFVEQVKQLVDSKVGIMAFTAEGKFHTERLSTSNAHAINPVAIFDVLRAPEYVDAVRSSFGVNLDVPNTQRRRAHLAYFKTLEPSAAHDLLVKHLRLRFADQQPDLVNAVPVSMKQMYYDLADNYRRQFFRTDLLNRPLLDIAI